MKGKKEGTSGTAPPNAVALLYVVRLNFCLDFRPRLFLPSRAQKYGDVEKNEKKP